MKSFLFFVLSFLATTSFAQMNTTLNLDFESQKSNGDPYVWLFSKDQGVSVIIDSTYSFQGRRSLYVDARQIKSTYLVYNYLPGKYLKGKQSISISAFIKADSITSPISVLMNQQRADASDETGTGGYKATKYPDSIFMNGWKRYRVTSLVDTTAEQVLIGLSLPKGKYWIDNVSIELDGRMVNDSPPPPIQLPTKEDLMWLDKNVTELDIRSSAALTKKEISPIEQNLKDVKVLALGEATHGTHEFFDVKIRLIKKLVKDYNFNVIAFEAPMSELYEVNNYIVKGAGHISSVVHGRAFYRIYDTGEIRELVEWLKKENLGRNIKNKIYFSGIDIGGTKPYENVQKFLSGADTNLSYQLQSVYETYLKPKRKLIEKQNFFHLVDSFYNAYHTNISTNRDVNGAEMKWIGQNLELIRQDAQNSYYRGLGNTLARDSMMAENVIWLGNYYSSSKIILWAHNSHINNSGASMGTQLYRELGDKYFTIGLTTEKGSFNIFPFSGVTPYPLIPAAKEIIEYYFSRLGKPAFMLTTHAAREKLKSFTQLGFRQLGTGATNNQFRSNYGKTLLELFDAIIFINETTPSKARSRN